MENRHINLKDYNTFAEMLSLGQDVINSLGDEIFSITTKRDLITETLKRIVPVNKEITSDLKSTEEAAAKIMEHFGFDGKPVNMQLGGENIEIKPKPESKTGMYCRYILKIDRLPQKILFEQQIKVKEHLKQIASLIAGYEEDDFIQRNNAGGDKPRNQRDKMKFDFYHRCLKEQNTILNFYLHDLKQHALKDSFANPTFWGRYEVSGLFQEFPYYFSLPYSEGYFNYKKIDLVTHRIGNALYPKVNDWRKLYYSDKDKFYKKYFKESSVTNIFKGIEHNIGLIPLRKNRSPIFKELKKLFESGFWIGFYALALSQIEGLFTEMCEIISPQNSINSSALPMKVQSVRASYYLSTAYFDYYQYHIPELRNKFMHTGYEEDLRLKSFDLLTDLSHIVKIFSELDNPMVHVTGLMKRRNTLEFVALGNFVHYFRLLSKLNKTHKDSLSKEVEEFETVFLIKECQIEFFIANIPDEINKLLEDFQRFIESNFSIENVKCDIIELKMNQILVILNEQKNKDLLQLLFSTKNDLLMHLRDYQFIFCHHNKYLPSLKPEVKRILIELHKKYNQKLNTIIRLADILLGEPVYFIPGSY